MYPPLWLLRRRGYGSLRQLRRLGSRLVRQIVGAVFAEIKNFARLARAPRKRYNGIIAGAYGSTAGCPMKETILNLVKFFEKEEYADQFLSGRLYLNWLRYYKRLEEASGDGRGDHAEAPAAWWQKDNLFIEFHDHPELNIRPEDFAGPILFSFTNYDDLNILCMTAIHTGEFDCENGLISLAEGEEDKLREQLKIGTRCSTMGPFAVVVRAADFVLRAKNAIEALGYTYNSTLVEYFDPVAFHGRFPLAKMPFQKRNIFSWQKEYRICVDTHVGGENAVVIDIGNISDLAAKMPATDVNASFQLLSRKA